MQKKLIKVTSPGRINIIGEHTDYNGGYVLPAAVNRCVTADISLNGTASVCNFRALDFSQDAHFDWQKDASPQSGWQNYLIGVIEEMRKRGAALAGVDIEFSGNVPVGSGMSSSAALECSIAYGLNELFDCGFDKMTLVELTKDAEHNYVGTRCGIMDQFASLYGKKDRAMFLDCRSLEYRYLPLPLGDYEILIYNSNVKHSNAESGYNDRRRDCERGAAVLQRYFPQVKLLRDADFPMLKKVKNELTATEYRRCHYILSENMRVLAATEALEKGDLKTLGSLLYESHAGMSEKYEISCPELDWLVDATRNKNYILGARMMGGGFGGCTINLIKKTHSKTFVNETATAYQARFGKVPTPYFLKIADGTRIIRNSNL